MTVADLLARLEELQRDLEVSFVYRRKDGSGVLLDWERAEVEPTLFVGEGDWMEGVTIFLPAQEAQGEDLTLSDLKGEEIDVDALFPPLDDIGKSAPAIPRW